MQRVQSTHLQMLEAGTLGGWTRGVIGADDSLHEVPGQQQAAGLSGYPRRSLGEVGAAHTRHGGRMRGAGRGGRRAWLSVGANRETEPRDRDNHARTARANRETETA